MKKRNFIKLLMSGGIMAAFLVCAINLTNVENKSSRGIAADKVDSIKLLEAIQKEREQNEKRTAELDTKEKKTIIAAAKEAKKEKKEAEKRVKALEKLVAKYQTDTDEEEDTDEKKGKKGKKDKSKGLDKLINFKMKMAMMNGMSGAEGGGMSSMLMLSMLGDDSDDNGSFDKMIDFKLKMSMFETMNASLSLNNSRDTQNYDDFGLNMFYQNNNGYAGMGVYDPYANSMFRSPCGQVNYPYQNNMTNQFPRSGWWNNNMQGPYMPQYMQRNNDPSWGISLSV